MEGYAVDGGTVRKPRTERFTAFHKSDRNFFLLFVIVCWIGALMGFAPAASARFHGQANFAAPLVLQVHAFAFVGWLVLLTVQVLLVRSLRQRQHMALGMTAFALIPVMLVTAFMSEQNTQRFHFDRGQPNLAFFIVPIAYLIGFAVLSILALLRRKQPAAHKRLILLATTVIIGAAYGRWWGDALFAMVGDGFWGTIVNTYSGSNLILLGAMGYDLATRGQLHPVYKAGAPAIWAGEIAVSFIYHSPGWIPVGQALIGR